VLRGGKAGFSQAMQGQPQAQASNQTLRNESGAQESKHAYAYAYEVQARDTVEVGRTK